MIIVFPLRLLESHPDYPLLRRLEEAIYLSAGGQAKFEHDIPLSLRQAIDEVIDTARTKRFTLDEIDKTEKTYLGTKVEILVRNALGAERGSKLDLLIDGVDVDVKNTVGSSWMIPEEAIGHPCILIKTDEVKSVCSFGLIVIRSEILGAPNKDKKANIKKAGLSNVYWLLKDAPYPRNFWLTMAPDVREKIVAPRGGTTRVAMLFRLHQRQPISRKLVVALAQQDDPMKRLRKNGGARDKLEQERIVILSGKTKKALIAKLGLPFCRPDEFVSTTIEKPDSGEAPS